MKTEIQISNLISNFKNIYDDNGYKAIVNLRDGACVVYRVNKHFDTLMTSYVGEKNAKKKWKDVTLFGCPDYIKEEIMKAYKEEAKTRKERQKQDAESDQIRDEVP
jgi:hypothetical protein